MRFSEECGTLSRYVLRLPIVAVYASVHTDPWSRMFDDRRAIKAFGFWTLSSSETFGRRIILLSTVRNELHY